MSRKFITEKEIAFIHRVTHELIKNVTGQVVFYYEIDLQRSKVDELYQETIQKVWKAPVKCNARVLWGNETSQATNLGIDSRYSLEVYFHPEELKERNLSPKEGDFVEFGQVFFEIASVTQPEIIFGQVNNKTDTKCVCVPAREGQFAAGGRYSEGRDNSHPIETSKAPDRGNPVD